jgi:hypothetical protein
MKYKVNDRVTLNRNYTNDYGTIPIGTAGTIRVLIPTLTCYKVDFPQQENVTVPEDDLDAE